jgi:predicted nucleic acid-binding protein
VTETAFFDTNVVLYLLSDDASRADRAEELLIAGGVVSVQVLNETASVCLGKLRMPWPEVDELLGAIRGACRVEPLTLETHELGVAIAKRYALSLYDALILAAARLAGAAVLYSEDMQNGQRIEGVRIVNPFLKA